MKKFEFLGRRLSKVEQRFIKGGVDPYDNVEGGGGCLNCLDEGCDSGKKCCPNHDQTKCECKTLLTDGVCPHFD
jgi:hypothetical protein